MNKRIFLLLLLLPAASHAKDTKSGWSPTKKIFMEAESLSPVSAEEFKVTFVDFAVREEKKRQPKSWDREAYKNKIFALFTENKEDAVYVVRLSRHRLGALWTLSCEGTIVDSGTSSSGKLLPGIVGNDPLWIAGNVYIAMEKRKEK